MPLRIKSMDAAFSVTALQSLTYRTAKFWTSDLHLCARKIHLNYYFRKIEIHTENSNRQNLRNQISDGNTVK